MLPLTKHLLVKKNMLNGELWRGPGGMGGGGFHDPFDIFREVFGQQGGGMGGGTKTGGGTGCNGSGRTTAGGRTMGGGGVITGD